MVRRISDKEPGYRRLKAGRGFRYVDPRGLAVKDAAVLKRLRALAVPPAWTDVWICARPEGHLQATGRDAKGRKQYIYNAEFRARRERTKFARMLDFARRLRRIRTAVARDLKLPGLPRDKVLATVVALLERTLIRVGNEEYARTNASYGLTTLLARHVDVKRTRVRFCFRGKSSVKHVIDLSDARLAAIVKKCRQSAAPGLFSVDSSEVNAYLKRVSGSRSVSAKDFRTWHATVLAAQELWEGRALLEAIDNVSKRLGNTRAICRKSYVHPAVIDAFQEGRLLAELGRRTPGEGAVQAFLARRAA